ncbi:hypothetical protein BJ546DRAFT_947642 [Cryomyces antarcticus]
MRCLNSRFKVWTRRHRARKRSNRHHRRPGQPLCDTPHAAVPVDRYVLPACTKAPCYFAALVCTSAHPVDVREKPRRQAVHTGGTALSDSLQNKQLPTNNLHTPQHSNSPIDRRPSRPGAFLVIVGRRIRAAESGLPRWGSAVLVLLLLLCAAVAPVRRACCGPGLFWGTWR